MSGIGDYGDRWAHVSLRTKITVVTVFILFLGLIVAGVGTFSVLRPILINQQSAKLQQLRNDPAPVLAPDANQSQITADDVFAANGDYYVAILDAEGTVEIDNSRGRRPASLPPVNHEGITLDWAKANVNAQVPFEVLSQDGTRWRYVTVPVLVQNQPSGVLLIAESTTGINQAVAQYIIVFTGFGIAVILLGAALTRILITTTLLPLAEVEQTALEIARGDYSKRIMVASPHTEVGHLGDSLNAMLDRLDGSLEDRERTIERMRRFVGDASHELRTPLVSVRGYAELYRMGALQDKEQVGQAMNRIEKEAIRMTSLVEDLLALARLDERRKLELAPLPLNQLALDAASDARAGDPDRVITVREDPQNPMVMGDEHKVRQLMTNLIGNARQHTPAGSPLEIVVTALPVPGAEGPTVEPESPTTSKKGAGAASEKSTGRGFFGTRTPARGNALRGAGARETTARDTAPTGAVPVSSVTAETPVAVPTSDNPTTQSLPTVPSLPSDTPMARFEIVDHGEGIPEQIREKIFGRFWRADSSRNRETGGSGLGLAIVKSIVEAHHGDISVHDTPGGGATFRVDLPAA